LIDKLLAQDLTEREIQDLKRRLTEIEDAARVLRSIGIGGRSLHLDELVVRNNIDVGGTVDGIDIANGVVLHSLADAENDFLVASGADAFIRKTLAQTGAILEADLDHGSIQGLGDDDHSLYLLASDATNRATFAANWTDLTDSGETSLHSHAGGAYTEGARVYNNADQTLGTAAWTSLALNSERYDTDSIHDTDTNNSRLTCKTAGKYSIVGSAMFVSNATGLRGIRIYLNNSTIIAKLYIQAINGDTTPMAISTIYDLDVDDYVELQSIQTSGGDLAVAYSAEETPEFMMQRVG